MTLNPNEAEAALNAVRDARRKMGRSGKLGWIHHLLYGAVMAGIILQLGFGGWRRVFIVGATIALGVLLYRWQRNATGRWNNGYRAGRTRWVAVGLLAALVAILFVTAPVAEPARQFLTVWQAALLAFVVATLGGWLWDKAYRADLERAA
ncbi:hypothetical protein [Sphingomonas hengshuiensis]|uniref:hypothetical protein n=1 Tax=Sphingomonas hengshuiensis TaxID=1609977 RepID=UPI00069915BD|nr:hypothetical protein [Sphingomonas hengshuiensis]